MNTQIKLQIEALAKANSTEEICGFLYHGLDSFIIYPCSNIAADKANEFEIDPQDYIACQSLGPICAIYHSHPKNPAFSEADISLSDEMSLPILVFAVAESEWNEYIPKSYQVQLEGRQFSWGFNDCYGLIRDYYRQAQGHYMRDYDRDDSFPETDGGTILANIDNEGFYDSGTLVDLQIGDVILFHSNRALPQHFGIFIGNSRFLHHPLGSLSRVELLSGNWRKRIVKILRKKTQD